jgi:DNA-binding NtrC family response regulator
MEAFKLIEAQTYDILLSDIIMPRISGVEFLDQFRKTCPDTPVIMMTGEPTVETAVLALQRGAFDYLNKPIQKSRAAQSCQTGDADTAPDTAKKGS